MMGYACLMCHGYNFKEENHDTYRFADLSNCLAKIQTGKHLSGEWDLWGYIIFRFNGNYLAGAVCVHTDAINGLSCLYRASIVCNHNKLGVKA